MIADTESDRKDFDRRIIEIKIERFREQCHTYLKQLPIFKQQLGRINSNEASNQYAQQLNDIGRIIQNLTHNLHNIETLHVQLEENDRIKIKQEIIRLRAEIDREMIEFRVLRQKTIEQSNNQCKMKVIETEKETSSIEENNETNQLRQRQVAANHLEDSYNALEKDLENLKKLVDQVAVLVSEQKEKLCLTERLVDSAQNNISNASSMLKSAVNNKYVLLTSGAVIGATVAGPVGFFMGMKAGAVAGLSGSIVGAVSANLMKRKTEKDEPVAYNQAML